MTDHPHPRAPRPQDDLAPLQRLGRGARLAGGLAFAAALSLGGAGMAAADPGDDLGTTTFSQSDQEGATEYWTAERMESAIPADTLIEGEQAPDGQVESSETVQVPRVDPLAATQTQSGEADWSFEADPSAAASGTDHIGKVFFTVGGNDYVCSGNAVASQNGSTVSTAGHCTSESGQWASNWVFAPAYDQGETPYGLWSATELYAPEQWVGQEDMNYDIAFAVVAPESGSTSLTDAVGGSGIEFNTERGALYTSFGYPAAAPFDGETLEQCQDYGSDDTLGGTDDQAIDCDMTGGSSGGPWFVGDGADGMQISVNSFGYTAQPNVMYGPYLGDVAQDVYAEAAAA
ncbi:trypsin-like serine peptidase [Brachybacterium sp. AOP43-C2-M15]|uniref:trypsin-like serine peptidase n=1 Tax=Brachybacterium sp. AOP43-C2-M15 TaxID=3457661 RepID=UPI00403386E8